jgi:integrase
MRSRSAYVFPGARPGKPMHPENKIYARVSGLSGVDFTRHDLRRSFSSIADSLDIPHYTLKRLLNHRSGSDVTLAYIVRLPERYREPMQAITNEVFRLAKIDKNGAMAASTGGRLPRRETI